MLSSLILGYSQCQKPINWRANPDEETTDWRARRGKTAHRVRREGTVKAVPYPYEDNKDVLAFFGGSAGHVGKYDLAWALRHNKLAFPKYLVLLDDLDQSRINQLDKGMSISDLDQRLFLHKKDEEVVRIIEKTVQDKKIPNLKGIVFCRSITHINYLIQFFPAGSATFVHSKMTDQQRWQNIRDFREGNYRYILVRDLFNEGIDIPETNLLVFMRYTGSHTVWLQQLGRGLRKTPNKDYVHVLDFVGSLERLNEVHQRTKRVNSVPIDKDNWEAPPRDKKETNRELQSLSKVRVGKNTGTLSNYVK